MPLNSLKVYIQCIHSFHRKMEQYIINFEWKDVEGQRWSGESVAVSVVGDVFERDVESDTGHRKWWWQVRRGSLSPHHDSGAAATSTLPTCLMPKWEENHGDISQTRARTHTHTHDSDEVNMTSFCCFKCTEAHVTLLFKKSAEFGAAEQNRIRGVLSFFLFL